MRAEVNVDSLWVVITWQWSVIYFNVRNTLQLHFKITKAITSVTPTTKALVWSNNPDHDCQEVTVKFMIARGYRPLSITHAHTQTYQLY